MDKKDAEILKMKERLAAKNFNGIKRMWPKMIEVLEEFRRHRRCCHKGNMDPTEDDKWRKDETEGKYFELRLFFREDWPKIKELKL